MFDAFAADDTKGADKDASTQTATGDQQVPYDLTAEKMMTDNFLLLGVIFFIFYFLLIRPQQKRVKMHQEMMDGLQKGNKILTNGGLIGVITKLEGDDIAILEIAPNVKVRVTRASVAEVLDGKAALGESANDN